MTITFNVVSQTAQFDVLERRLREGDFSALEEVGKYFDSKVSLIEYLGYHVIASDESLVSKRLVLENTLFLDSEIQIDTSTTSANFESFLNNNKDRIKYSSLAGAFLITDFYQRATKYRVLELTNNRWSELNVKRTQLLNLEWVSANRIDSLVQSKNPEALLKIASFFLRNRYRFNDYDYHRAEEAIDLIQLLTKSRIAVPNQTGKLSYHLDKEYYNESRINLLIFFANNYKDYTWNDSTNTFKNENIENTPLVEEEKLFELLSQKNDSLALSSFIDLTTANPDKVIELSNQYMVADVSTNYILPTFEFKFLKQLVQLTDYSRRHDVNYIGSENLRSQIELLKTKLTFKQRKELEDKLINSLTLDDITAFEYWSLIYQKSWSLTYSAGRILDRFYSKNWNALINDPKHINLYLFKSRLFDDLGIIGYCNNYLVKFRGSNQKTLAILNNIQSTNDKINKQIQKALIIANKPTIFKPKEKKSWRGNMPVEILDFDESYSQILINKQDDTKLENDVIFLLSQIKFDQIGKALKAIEYAPIAPYKKFSFLSKDFGFSYIGNFGTDHVRNNFLANYEKLDELNLHKFYLMKAGFRFTNIDDSLDYNQIYDILKYDIADAFVGGGGSTKDNGVYSIIKILELTFGTTLGYPEKLCSSNNMYACNSRGRAREWMNYLKTNNHATAIPDEPVSFAYD